MRTGTELFGGINGVFHWNSMMAGSGVSQDGEEVQSNSEKLQRTPQQLQWKQEYFLQSFEGSAILERQMQQDTRKVVGPRSSLSLPEGVGLVGSLTILVIKSLPRWLRLCLNHLISPCFGFPVSDPPFVLAAGSSAVSVAGLPGAAAISSLFGGWLTLLLGAPWVVLNIEGGSVSNNLSVSVGWNSWNLVPLRRLGIDVTWPLPGWLEPLETIKLLPSCSWAAVLASLSAEPHLNLVDPFLDDSGSKIMFQRQSLVW